MEEADRDEEVLGGPREVAETVDLDDPTPQAGQGLRRRTARGVLINSGFRIGLAGVNLGRNLGIAAFLTREEYGLWGLIVTTLITLAFLKQLGISAKYIQQRETDQELAFQKAWTFDLVSTLVFYVIVAIAIPVYGLLVYGRPAIIAPAAVLSLVLIASTFQTPTWVFYRRMQYGRQRALESLDPLITVTVTIILLAVGLGIWGLVIGAVAGSISAAVAAVVASPYRLRFRWDAATVREYLGFSWPLFLNGLSALLVVQGALIAGNAALGLAAVGTIGLATNFARFSNRIEGLIRNTLYPAICAVQENRELLREVFVKANRIGLMWAIPFGVGLALFAPDFVELVLGSRWEPAVPLLQVFGLIFATGTIGFAWMSFYSATGNTRPIVTVSLAVFVVFFAVTLPLMLTVGVMGYAIGMSVNSLLTLAIRWVYVERFFPGFSFGRHVLRAVLPILAPVAVVAAVRLSSWGGSRTGVEVVTELFAYGAVTVIVTYLAERGLIHEVAGYLRKALRPSEASGSPLPATPGGSP